MLKGSSSKIPANCPNGIKLYNNKMGEVDLMDQLKSAYQLEFALFNSFIVCKKLENKDLTLKGFKICMALKLIASFFS